MSDRGASLRRRAATCVLCSTSHTVHSWSSPAAASSFPASGLALPTRSLVPDEGRHLLGGLSYSGRSVAVLSFLLMQTNLEP